MKNVIEIIRIGFKEEPLTSEKMGTLIWFLTVDFHRGGVSKWLPVS